MSSTGIPWNDVLADIVAGIVILIAGGIGGGIAGFAKGKKKSSKAIERKENIYLPLIEELTLISNFDFRITEQVDTPILNDMIQNTYKYEFNNKELEIKCQYLYSLIEKYKETNVIEVAHNIVVGIFEKAYIDLFGSIVDGTCTHSDREGNEYEEEVLAQPVICLRELDFKSEIKYLLDNEGMYSEDVCVDEENAIYEPIYGELKSIYNKALNISINGERYKLPKMKYDIHTGIAEHIAYSYDFFAIYNENLAINEKYKLREDIIYKSQEIIQDLKDIIRKIIKLYELEEL